MTTDKKGTVLIVDDEAGNLGVLFEHLCQSGFRVLAAEDGESALKVLSRVLPDIALLDVKLPDIDGFELCRRMQKQCLDIPVIFLTGLADRQDIVRGLNLNAVDYITKPFFPEEVVARVNRHLMMKNLQKSIHEKNIQLEQEIAEHRKTEQVLQEKERLLSDIINFLPDATFVIDTHGKILSWNKAMETMTGIKTEEMLGKDNYEYAIPFYGDRRPILIDLAFESVIDIEKKYDQIHISRDNLTAEQYFPDLLGRETWLSGAACALRNSQGEIVGAIESIRNITERKKARQSLQEAKNKAETANRAKSVFLANMSHELRTPLNGILGYAQILKRNPALTKQQKKGLDIIEKNGNHLLSLLNEILDIAKIESGKIDLHENDFHFPGFIQNLCDNIRVRAQSKGICLNLEIPQKSEQPESQKTSLPIYIRADEKRLYQILINLLDNAVKFTDKGSITLRISAKKPDKKEITAPDSCSSTLTLHRILFEIEDTGTGISAEELGKIFEPFHQSGDKKYRAEGTGLGLSITRNLIDLIGGKLRVHSRLGSGSIFIFEAMLAEVPKEKQAAINRIINKNGKNLNKSPGFILPSAEILENLENYSDMKDIEEIRNLLGVLKQAATDGDSEKLYRTIAGIHPQNSVLAEKLTRLTDDFAFDTIVTVIQKLCCKLP